MIREQANSLATVAIIWKRAANFPNSKKFIHVTTQSNEIPNSFWAMGTCNNKSSGITL